MIKGVLLDLSGVLYVGDEPIPGAVQAMRRLRDTGMPMRFITNTTRSTCAAVQAKLAGMGFEVGPQDIYTVPRVVRQYALERDLRPYFVIHPNLQAEFSDMRSDEPNAVVLGDAGEAFDYAHLNRAFRLLMGGAPLLVMGENRYFLESDGLSLDIGPFVKALEYAVDITALVFGKPSKAFFLSAVADMGCTPEQVLMVGDDALSDIDGALNAGLQGALVKTGKYRAGDENYAKPSGAWLMEDVSAVVAKLLAP